MPDTPTDCTHAEGSSDVVDDPIWTGLTLVLDVSLLLRWMGHAVLKG